MYVALHFVHSIFPVKQQFQYFPWPPILYFSDLQAQGSLPVAHEAVRGVEGGVQDVPRHDRQVGHELEAEGQDAARHQEADDRLQRREGTQGRIGVV